MLCITLEKYDDTQAPSTCAVCMQEIVKTELVVHASSKGAVVETYLALEAYWRCPNSVCGDVGGPGRVCTDCHVKVVNKDRCVSCNRPLFENPIADPRLLEYAVNVDPVGEHAKHFLLASVRQLAQTHLDEVIAFSCHNANVRYFLTEVATRYWYLYPLDAIQKLYQHLKSAIMVQWSDYYTTTIYAWDRITEAIEKRPAWLLDTAKWIIKWRDERECTAMISFGASKYQCRLEFEAMLLDACETKEEFMVLRDLAVKEDNHEYLHVDVIAIYIRTAKPGKEWVMHSLLEDIGDGKQWTNDMHRILTKFDYESVYEWIAKQRRFVLHFPPNVELARKYGLLPLFYACYSRGVYTQTPDKRITPVIGFNTGDVECSMLPDAVMYVDLSSDTLRDDWASVPDLKTVDAKGGTLTVETYENVGVQLYLDDVQLVFVGAASRTTKIVGFSLLRVNHVKNAKRKIQCIE